MIGMAPFEQVEAGFWHADVKYGMLPPLTQDMIAAAEHELGVTLPADLLRLLRIQNGGVVAEAWDACPAEANFYADDHVPFDHLFGIGPSDSRSKRGTQLPTDLIQRINEGCLKAATLHREIRSKGFAGSYAIIRKFVEQYRTNPDLASTRRPPSVRQVTGWICRRPDDLVDRDTEQLQTILERCPELRTAGELVRSFADMLGRLRGQRLSAWIAAAEAAALPGITKFATGLTADLDAVTAGSPCLSVPGRSKATSTASR